MYPLVWIVYGVPGKKTRSKCWISFLVTAGLQGALQVQVTKKKILKCKKLVFVLQHLYTNMVYLKHVLKTV